MLVGYQVAKPLAFLLESSRLIPRPSRELCTRDVRVLRQVDHQFCIRAAGGNTYNKEMGLFVQRLLAWLLRLQILLCSDLSSAKLLLTFNLPKKS